MLDTQFLTVAEVAQKIRRSPTTIITAINHGHLKAHRVGGSRWLIDENDFKAWFDAGALTTAPRSDTTDEAAAS